MTKKKRFISGASCPQCHAEDELVIYELDGKDVFECLACGHMQKRPSVADQDQAKSLETRSGPADVQIVELKPKSNK